MAAERELVRCGCGVVRNDDDRLSPLADPMPCVLFERWELPRHCRGCGAVYMLPRPSAPKGAINDA